jgi:hypothetical protein
MPNRSQLKGAKTGTLWDTIRLNKFKKEPLNFMKKN